MLTEKKSHQTNADTDKDPYGRKLIDKSTYKQKPTQTEAHIKKAFLWALFMWTFVLENYQSCGLLAV